ncbi:YtxH domain-containing protein [Bacillus sp. S/N-304-OC-R1]|uniref:YtxH domain-containing protein n=1 Tax=Bacillus sp. S/N-304-OC-R1 TaxID=2758034 RepID=UPI001C8D538E|nr:YtxH domain-containing protein [Bacillus sp. S/N-304-OC-R1]MBY0123076.1 YtxH domain-containing protein [Bacillus sp. S/N-304-OC-R1]
MKTKSLLLGFLIGGAAAGITTLLTAPNSGVQTRKNLKESTDIMKKQMTELKDQILDIKNAAVKASKEGKNMIAAFSSDMKVVISEWKRDILPHQQTLQMEIHAIEAAISDLEKSLDIKNEKK